MYTGEYKGDSPNKKMVRALAWNFAIDLMKGINQEVSGAYVLAGHGGDIRTLKGVIDLMYPRDSEYRRKLYPITLYPEKWLHRPNIDITAVDYNQSLIDRLHEDLDYIVDEPESGIGSITGYVGDAARLVKKAKPYNLSHMDFCNAISVENLYTVGEVIRASTGLSYHMITVMRGREAGPKRNDIIVPNLHRGERRLLKRHIKKVCANDPHFVDIGGSILSKGMLDVKSLIKEVESGMRAFVAAKKKATDIDEAYLYFKKDGSLTPYATGIARSTVFKELLGVMLRDTHAVGVAYTDSYHSNNADSRGTPFTTFGLLAVPIKGCTKFPGITYSHINGEAEDCLEVASTVAEALLRRASSMKLSGNKMALYHGMKESDKILRYNACLTAMYRGTKTAADIYCVDKGTVTAWLAHARRGSYGEFIKDMGQQYASFPEGHPSRPKAQFFSYADKTRFAF